MSGEAAGHASSPLVAKLILCFAVLVPGCATRGEIKTSKNSRYHRSDRLRCLCGLLFKRFLCEQEITEATERANREGVFKSSSCSRRKKNPLTI
jgi:hypothetical protein